MKTDLVYKKWLKTRYKCDYCGKGFRDLMAKLKHQWKCKK